MRFLIIILIISLIVIVSDILAYKSINAAFGQILSKNILAKIIYWSIPTVIFSLLGFAIYRLTSAPHDIFAVNTLHFVTGLTILFLVPKLDSSIFYLFDQLAFLVFQKHFFLNKIGLVVAGIMFFVVLHGITINKTNFQVREQQILSQKIPNNFNGFKIIQISDLHIGSFHKDIESIQKLVIQINAEKPDIIVFTGDMISNYAEEMDEFIPVLTKLKSKYGKYAILGNHDYGEYVNWKSKEEEEQNLSKLIFKHQEIGFQLLDNKCSRIKIDNQEIQLIGVENWGLPPFPQYGNIEQSITKLDTNNFTILLSHDPSHWRAEILAYPQIDLTLSGHTHAMQFGFELGSWKWSPVMFKYKEWAGLYQDKNQYLYVNRGTGYIGFPGRVGIRPEITKLILKSN